MTTIVDSVRFRRPMSRHRVNVVTMLVIQVLFTFGGTAFHDPRTGLPFAWVAPLSSFMLITLCWPTSSDGDATEEFRDRSGDESLDRPGAASADGSGVGSSHGPAGVPPLRTALLGLVCAFVIGAVLGGVSVGPAVWMGLVNVLVSALGAWTLKRVLSRRDWGIWVSGDIVLYGFAAFFMAGILVLLSGVPDDTLPLPRLWHEFATRGGFGAVLDRGELRDVLALGYGAAAEGLSTWWGPLYSHLGVGLPTVTVLFLRPRHFLTRTAPLRMLVPMVLVAEATLLLPVFVPQFPLTWTLLIPAVWFGLTLTPRAIVFSSFAIFLNVVVLRVTVSPLTDSTTASSTLLTPNLMMTPIVMLAYGLVFAREEHLRLVAELAERRDAERVQNELFDALYRVMTDGMIVSTPDGRVLTANPAARALLGERLPRHTSTRAWQEALGLQPVPGQREVPGSALDAVLDPAQESFAEVDVALGGRDVPRVMHLAGRVVTAGDEGHRLLVVTDISEKHAHTRRLETFASTVAEDLRGPLAALTQWMEEADEELGREQEEAGARALDKARQAAVRMRDLIDTYLAYTVTREGVLRQRTVDLAALVQLAVQAKAGPETGAVVDLGPLHPVYADSSLTNRLLETLLAQIVGHGTSENPARLTIFSDARREPGWVRVTVREEGTPISEAERHHFMAAFGQLGEAAGHSPDPSQMGPALCRAIVERHGGRISAFDDGRGGTTIEFTLPAAN